MKKNLTCIRCPLGCQLVVNIETDGNIKISNNKCKRGYVYARKELIDPKRVVTTTVKVNNGNINMLPVKTNGDIPIKMVFDCVQHIKGTYVNAPINIGDVIIYNVLNTGVDIVATRNINLL